MAQWSRLHTSNAGGVGSTPGQELRSHMLHGQKIIIKIKKYNGGDDNKPSFLGLLCILPKTSMGEGG